MNGSVMGLKEKERLRGRSGKGVEVGRTVRRKRYGGRASERIRARHRGIVRIGAEGQPG